MSLIVCRFIGDRAVVELPWIYGSALAETCGGYAKPRGLARKRSRMKPVHRTYISDLERGARNPTITVVEKLAAALGVRPGELLDRAG
jgi:transcriptional regulator with XRE-family HTH domain